ncbi:MAG TPA: sulfurtransferase [Jiangellaceae bacterium]
MNVLISVDELADVMDSPSAPVLLDVRWALGDPHGRTHYLQGHLPGAVYVDLETELAGHPSPRAGRHPLPDLTDLQAAAREWGIRQGGTVVAYDDVGGTSAARAWWLLRWAGVADVWLLDGGLGAWRASGRAVESGDVTPEPGNVMLRAGGMPTVDADGAAGIARSGALLDARAAERYRGEVEPVDPVAGHIPGAVSAPTTENLQADGRFLPAVVLRERFAALGVNPSGLVGAYCGSGVTASHEVAALAIAGIDAALYAGSWSQWCNDPARPVATGA